MKLGMIGLPSTGKKTLFRLLTGMKPSTSEARGMARIRDDRFDSLVRLYKPKSEAPARLDLELLPRIESENIRTGTIFHDIAMTDALCHVVRTFQDDSVYHVEGSVDPMRDIRIVNEELNLHDLLFIEKRMERIEAARRKKADRSLDEEEEALVKCKNHLEKELHLRTMEFSDEENRILSGYPLITRKRMLVVLNVGEKEAADASLIQETGRTFAHLDLDVMAVSAALEEEISLLEDEGERAEFMRDAGIKKPALELLSRLAIKSLDLITFFTVGSDEVKQWPARKGSTAPEAAGVIHSDIQRGFIRAEVMKYDQLMEEGSEEALKKAGKFYVMGKDYIIEDGDIINFRFNV